jgi:two-component system chemotaxis response regulator CheB
VVTRRYSVLVVDDSAFMRRLVASIIEAEPTLTVAGTARDGREAIEKVEQLRPDVVTLDVEMPGTDGFAALEQIMKLRPTPVIMVSSLTKEGAEATIRCLELGAIDFLPKPTTHFMADADTIAQELVAKIRAAASASVGKSETGRFAPASRVTNRAHAARTKCVFIASSTGGPKALTAVVPRLPADLGVPVVIVQHMPAGFTRALAARLDSASAIQVVEAEHGQFLRPNVAYIAPGWTHMEVQGTGRIAIVDGPAVNGVKPAADVTLNSLCDLYGPSVCGVVLTGMGKDGAAALKRLHGLGGWTIAEAEETCVVYGMPRAAVQCGAAELVLPLHEIATEIARCVASDSRRATA